MSINRKRLGALLCVVAIGIAVASTAGAASQSTPGVTANQVTIGGTFPLSEAATPNGASLYATIAGAEQAYYGYVNAHGGVNGRTIKDIVKDDQYTPSETFTKTKTARRERPRLRDRRQPRDGARRSPPGTTSTTRRCRRCCSPPATRTGDSARRRASAFHPIKGVCPKPKPWTMGWQPDYPGEAKHLREVHPQPPGARRPKIGIL